MKKKKLEQDKKSIKRHNNMLKIIQRRNLKEKNKRTTIVLDGCTVPKDGHEVVWRKAQWKQQMKQEICCSQFTMGKYHRMMMVFFFFWCFRFISFFSENQPNLCFFPTAFPISFVSCKLQCHLEGQLLCRLFLMFQNTGLLPHHLSSLLTITYSVLHCFICSFLPSSTSVHVQFLLVSYMMCSIVLESTLSALLV